MTLHAGSDAPALSTVPLAPIVVVDASVWVSRLLTQDPNHIAVRTWANEHIRNGGTFTSPVILAVEVAASISRRTKSIADARIAANQLYALPVMRLVAMDSTLVNESTELAAGLGLRGADAIYVALAMQLGIPLVTFDTEQLTRPARLITTISP